MNDLARFTQASAPVQTQGGAPINDATVLTGAGGIGYIRLGEAIYTLRITRAGKLILTK
jgi:hemin uptake protein HemP